MRMYPVMNNINGTDMPITKAVIRYLDPTVTCPAVQLPSKGIVFNSLSENREIALLKLRLVTS
jgi:hypothetical protein